MSDESSPKGGVVASIAAAASAFAYTPFPYFLGLAVMFAAVKWDGSIHPRDGCVQFQSINGATYKVDTCNAKAEPVLVPASSPAVSSQSSSSSPPAASTQ